VGELFGFRGLRQEGTRQDTAATALSTDSTTMPVNTILHGDFERRGSASMSNRRSSKDGPSQFYEMPLTVQFSLRQNRNYETRQVTSSLGTSSSFMITPRFSVDVLYNFDLDRKEVRDTQISVTRDLHCWEASFQWSPLGFRPGYFLRIGVKTPQLRDVKVERQRGSGFGGQYY